MNSESTPKQKAARKVPSSAWKPGQSGNPGGRPKVVAEVRELARQYGYEAIQRLVVLLHSSNEAVSIRAAEALLDRGYGRPMQGVELTSIEAARHRWHVEIVPTPKRVDNAPPFDSLPSNEIAKPNYGLTNLENEVITLSGRRWPV